MSWQTSLDDDERALLTAWTRNVLHDLVKYLEMMPRSLNWEQLDDGDLDIIYESIVETRAGRGGTTAALTIWEQALGDLPPELREKVPPIQQVDAIVRELDASGRELGTSLDDVDVEALRERIFGVGERLRSMRDELTEV